MGIAASSSPARYRPAISDPTDPQPFAVHRHEHGTALVVEVHGEIDLSTADGVRAATDAPQAQRLVLDLRGVDFMDTSGIRLVVELMRAEDAGGPQLALVADTPPVLRLFDMAGLTSRLRLASSVDEALE
jgi:anti-anti-sigma factor